MEEATKVEEIMVGMCPVCGGVKGMQAGMRQIQEIFYENCGRLYQQVRERDVPVYNNFA
ncbi:MAG: hypothetical protein ACP5QK_11135 [Myxococcota bacterium]